MFFPRKRLSLTGRWTCSVLGVLALVCVPFLAASADKVDPRVWEDTANGRNATFLVLLADQTNTMAVARSKAERRSRHQAVVEALREHAGRSQAGLRSHLESQGARHR